MNEFAEYVNELETLAKQYIDRTLSLELHREKLTSALDGGPNRALRKVVPLKKLQETGTYFTGDVLANLVLENFIEKSFSKLIYDPACGVGDLLISAARQLPLLDNLTQTLKHWGERLYGYDLHPEFIRATKARLVLTALARGVQIDRNPMQNVDELFPNIHINDGLTTSINSLMPSWILLNPPFHPVKVSKDCQWAGGKVSAAALFLDKWISGSAQGTKIIAILPDVLRSGSFYKHWRENIISKALINKIEIYGKFDDLTEVDVFILYLTVDSKQNKDLSADWWETTTDTKNTVGDLFDISVGRVVPYRDAEEGPEYDYIEPKTLPKWETLKSISKRRKFSGKVTRPPFVVIRRNSRSDDKYRAVGTLIISSNPIAVENHLIILKPKDGKISTCNNLLDLLKSPEANSWLNQRIRCRHLTVPAIEQLPWTATE